MTLYDFLLPLGAAAAAPAYLLRSLRHPEYRHHLGERLGRLPRDLTDRLDALPRRPVWIQAVSVGEVGLARALIRALARETTLQERPLPLVLSTTTPAGRDTAAAIREPGLVGSFYFPIDWKPFVRRTLRGVKPSALVCVETELWPGTLTQCRQRGVPVVLINGRISETSGRRYLRLGGMLRGPLEAVRLACMQSEDDARRLRAIGVPADRVVVTGNMKFDAAPLMPEGLEAGRRAYGIPDSVSRVLVAGSTSAGEEEMLLDAVALAGLQQTLVILAPRHRERFDEVAALLRRRGLSFARRSELPEVAHRQVLLLDTIGELARAYALASVAGVAFVGGSLVPRGGQNLIEPAACGVPVLFGPHTASFAAVADSLIQAGAGFRVDGVEGLAAELRRLFQDGASRRAAGRAGRNLIEAHRGATDRTVHQILPFLG